METGKWWDSFTNILALIVVLALVFFTFLRLLPIEIFSGAVTLILGAYFQRSGQKDGQKAAIESQTATVTNVTNTAQPVPTVVADEVSKG